MSLNDSSPAYARAIFEAAEHANVLDVVYQDFRRQLQLLDESKEFSAFIRARSMDESRAKVLEKIFTDALHPLTMKFLRFLANKNRLENFPAIIHDFIELYREKRGIVAMDVTSYGSLDESTLKDITRKWSHRLGKSVELNVHIDPSILGGAIFKIKDQVEDYSIKSQLERLREQLIK